MINFLAASVVSSLLARILLTVGVSFVVFQGMDTTLSFALTELKNVIGELPSVVLNLLGLASVDYMINMVFAGLSARVAMASLKSFTMRT